MDATMMQFPLSTQMILRRGARLFGNSQVISFDGSHLRSASYAEVAHRARQLASALNAYGLAMGDRVGTLCWNTQEHLEAYLAVPAMGAVLHTVNVRLAADQISYIVGHAEDRVLIIDASFCRWSPRSLRICHRLILSSCLAMRLRTCRDFQARSWAMTR